jgi:U3 small nucleolar RNA-associated protein 21
MYNMQSGIKRKSFDIGPLPEATSVGTSVKRKERCVTGIASDALNRTVVASTLDGTVNVGDEQN